MAKHLATESHTRPLGRAWCWAWDLCWAHVSKSVLRIYCLCPEPMILLLPKDACPKRYCFDPSMPCCCPKVSCLCYEYDEYDPCCCLQSSCPCPQEAFRCLKIVFGHHLHLVALFECIVAGFCTAVRRAPFLFLHLEVQMLSHGEDQIWGSGWGWGYVASRRNNWLGRHGLVCKLLSWEVSRDRRKGKTLYCTWEALGLVAPSYVF